MTKETIVWLLNLIGQINFQLKQKDQFHIAEKAEEELNKLLEIAKNDNSVLS